MSTGIAVSGGATNFTACGIDTSKLAARVHALHTTLPVRGCVRCTSTSLRCFEHGSYHFMAFWIKRAVV